MFVTQKCFITYFKLMKLEEFVNFCLNFFRNYRKYIFLAMFIKIVVILKFTYFDVAWMYYYNKIYLVI